MGIEICFVGFAGIVQVLGGLCQLEILLVKLLHACDNEILEVFTAFQSAMLHEDTENSIG
jgi:hypothetical protein